MRIDLRGGRLLYRDPKADQAYEGFLCGDVWEFYDPPIKAVDPRTRRCTEQLQCFRVINDTLMLQPVARGSWLTEGCPTGKGRAR